jgi:hypothetical protein
MMSKARELMVARLAAAYRQGRLVPFLGAGMSVPACPGWETFIIGLERQAFGRKQPSRTGQNVSDELIRRANNAVRHLRLRGETVFHHALMQALKGKASDQIPPQTQALAKIYWPLTLTSNYDDLFYRAWKKSQSASNPVLQVLGRTPNDCRLVLASLHSSRPPILWALQGYVGRLSGIDLHEFRRAMALNKLGQTAYGDNLVKTFDQQRKHSEAIKNRTEKDKREELRRQLVVGHEEYRRVAFTAPQFRRAFAEVFRSRSFLFVGSGLSEQYFLNLFGEALEIYGRSPFPHYAFVKKGSTDPEFLRSRLNTFVYEYDDHGDLPIILNELHQTVENRSALTRTWSYSMATSVRSRKDRKVSDIHIVRGWLPEPKAHECLAVGVGLKKDRKPDISAFEKDLFKNMGCLQSVSNLKFPDGVVSLRVPDQPLYLFSISSPDGQPDLRFFSRAVADLLAKVSPKEFSIIRTKLPFPESRKSASFISKLVSGFFGKMFRLFQADILLRFWLMEIIHVYGAWRRNKGGQGLLELAVHLTDPAVLFDMTTGRIDPLELLMCDDLRFTVEIEHDSHTLVSESYQCLGNLTLRELAKAMGLFGSMVEQQAEGEWLVEVEPSPNGFPFIRSLATSSAPDEGLNTTLSELGVVTDGVLRFLRRTMPDETAGKTPTGVKGASQKRKAAAVKKRAAAKKKPAKKKVSPKKKQ